MIAPSSFGFLENKYGREERHVSKLKLEIPTTNETFIGSSLYIDTCSAGIPIFARQGLAIDISAGPCGGFVSSTVVL